jgi:catechol 2,3-dioxygenase-like lactoylglutathione lyase family enzyme
MITGAHVVIYSKDAEADRAFFRNVLGLRAVDAGHGWLIFALPGAEAAFHPFQDNNRHELFLMCDDVKGSMVSLASKGVRFGEVAEEQWGIRTRMLLPGGGEIALYEPKHPVTFAGKERGGRAARASKGNKGVRRSRRGKRGSRR